MGTDDYINSCINYVENLPLCKETIIPFCKDVQREYVKLKRYVVIGHLIFLCLLVTIVMLLIGILKVIVKRN